MAEAGALIRPVRAEDTEACARILYEAFKGIDARHGFPPEFDPERAGAVARARIDHPSVFGVVAEGDGRVLGFCFLLESDPIRGLGPICVDPRVQAGGVGRRLMAAALERAHGADGVRLVQVAYNTASLPLYTSLGFEVKEPLVLMRGKPASRPTGPIEVRPLAETDLEACAALCRRVHGFGRGGELRYALGRLAPLVAVRAGRITGYVSGRSLGQATHGVAETDEDMRALLLAAGELNAEPYSLLVPTRQASIFRWCLGEGLRVVRPLNLMAMGTYQEAQGSWFPSILY